MSRRSSTGRRPSARAAMPSAVTLPARAWRMPSERARRATYQPVPGVGELEGPPVPLRDSADEPLVLEL